MYCIESSLAALAVLKERPGTMRRFEESRVLCQTPFQVNVVLHP
jgi:hypothetical protein